MRSKLTAFVTAGLLTGLGLAPPAASAADHMKMTFNWVADTGYIPFLYADELGFYKDAGIEMEFEQGRGSLVTAQLIAQGKADVGYADLGAAISVAAKGGPIKIIAIINQANSYGIVSLADSGIKTPKDLVGKKIAVCPGCAQVVLLDAMIAAQHLDLAEVQVENVQELAFAGLLTEKKVDGVAQDPQTIMVPLSQKGIATQIMYFRDHGVALVSFGLIANVDKLTANPDLYKRFVAASLKGLAAAIKDPEAGVDALRKHYPELGAEGDGAGELQQVRHPDLLHRRRQEPRQPAAIGLGHELQDHDREHEHPHRQANELLLHNGVPAGRRAGLLSPAGDCIAGDE